MVQGQLTRIAQTAIRQCIVNHRQHGSYDGQIPTHGTNPHTLGTSLLQ